MHEAAITRSLIDSVLQECESRGVKLVKHIFVEVGLATTFQKDPIEYYFDFFKKEHLLLAQAILHVSMMSGDKINLKSIEVDE